MNSAIAILIIFVCSIGFVLSCCNLSRSWERAKAKVEEKRGERVRVHVSEKWDTLGTQEPKVAVLLNIYQARSGEREYPCAVVEWPNGIISTLNLLDDVWLEVVKDGQDDRE